MVKTLPANAGGTRDLSSIPGSGRSPGGGNGNPLQYSCLENSMDRGAWCPTVRGVAKESDTTEHTHTHHKNYLPCLAVIVEDGYYYYLCFTKEEMKL